MEAAKTHLVQPGAVFWAYLVGLKEMGFAILGVAQKNRNACGINQIRIAFHIYLETQGIPSFLSLGPEMQRYFLRNFTCFIAIQKGSSVPGALGYDSNLDTD